MIKSRKDIPEGDPNPDDNEVEGREPKRTADHHDSARQAELEAGNLDEGFFKRAGKSIKKTLAGQTTVGQIGAVLKDVILPFVPSGGVINRTTDRISGIFKSQQTEKPKMNWLKNRLKEKSTWRGLVAFITALGVSLSPEQAAAIVTAGVALIGVFEAFFKEPQSEDAK